VCWKEMVGRHTWLASYAIERQIIQVASILRNSISEAASRTRSWAEDNSLRAVD
jgi:hypothetical protein